MAETETVYDPRTGTTTEAPVRRDRVARLRQETGGDDVEIVPQFDRGNIRGITDFSQPTVRQIIEHNVSIFAQAIQLRNTKLAMAITGLMPGMDGFDVLRREMGETEPVEVDHPWRQLIHRPNPTWSAFRFWRWMGKVRDLQGHADAIIERDSAGVPVNLWPVYAEWGRIKKKLDGRGGIRQYVFEFQGGGEPIMIEPMNLIRLEHPDPVQAGQTASLLERGVYELTSEVESKRFEKGFMEDGRPPNVYVKLDSDGDLNVVNPEVQQEAGERMQQGYMGSRANKLPVLKGGDFKSISLNPDDLQMLESREMRKDDILTITGTPPALFGKDPTNANVQGAERIFSVHTLQPMAVEAASTLTQQYERAFQAEEGRLIVQAPNTVPKDEQERAEIQDTQVKSGAKTLNDIRRENGDEEYDVDMADEPLIPQGLVPASMAGQSGASVPEERTPPDFL